MSHEPCHAMLRHAMPAVVHVLYRTRPHSLACCGRRPVYHHHPVVFRLIWSGRVFTLILLFIIVLLLLLCASCLVHDPALALALVFLHYLLTYPQPTYLHLPI
jgi:hypothetical protein